MSLSPYTNTQSTMPSLVLSVHSIQFKHRILTKWFHKPRQSRRQKASSNAWRVRKKCWEIPGRKGKGRDGGLEIYPSHLPGVDSARVQQRISDITDRFPSHQQNITLMRSRLYFRGQPKGLTSYRALSFSRDKIFNVFIKKLKLLLTRKATYVIHYASFIR